jgi:hypothetical protein
MMLPPPAMPASLRATIDPPPQPNRVYDTPPLVTRWRRWPRLRGPGTPGASVGPDAPTVSTPGQAGRRIASGGMS